MRRIQSETCGGCVTFEWEDKVTVSGKRRTSGLLSLLIPSHSPRRVKIPNWTCAPCWHCQRWRTRAISRAGCCWTSKYRPLLIQWNSNPENRSSVISLTCKTNTELLVMAACDPHRGGSKALRAHEGAEQYLQSASLGSGGKSLSSVVECIQ